MKLYVSDLLGSDASLTARSCCRNLNSYPSHQEQNQTSKLQFSKRRMLGGSQDSALIWDLCPNLADFELPEITSFLGPTLKMLPGLRETPRSVSMPGGLVSRDVSCQLNSSKPTSRASKMAAASQPCGGAGREESTIAPQETCLSLGLNVSTHLIPVPSPNSPDSLLDRGGLCV